MSAIREENIPENRPFLLPSDPIGFAKQGLQKKADFLRYSSERQQRNLPNVDFGHSPTQEKNFAPERPINESENSKSTVRRLYRREIEARFTSIWPSGSRGHSSLHSSPEVLRLLKREFEEKHSTFNERSARDFENGMIAKFLESPQLRQAIQGNRLLSPMQLGSVFESFVLNVPLPPPMRPSIDRERPNSAAGGGRCLDCHATMTGVQFKFEPSSLTALSSFFLMRQNRVSL